jgi:hypothetical protein
MIKDRELAESVQRLRRTAREWFTNEPKDPEGEAFHACEQALDLLATSDFEKVPVVLRRLADHYGIA